MGRSAGRCVGIGRWFGRSVARYMYNTIQILFIQSEIQNSIPLTMNSYLPTYKGSLTVWALYAYFSDSQNAAFELLVWCM